MFFNKYLNLYLWTCVINSVSSLNILSIFEHEGQSHQIFNSRLVRGLANRGHNVTVINFYPHFKNDTEFVKEISTGPHGAKSFVAVVPPRSINSRLNLYMEYVTTMIYLSRGTKSCMELLQNEKVQRLWKGADRFDVVLLEQYNVDCSIAIAYQMDAPMVGVHTDRLMPWNHKRYECANYPKPSLHRFLIASRSEVNLFHRFENYIVTSIFDVFFRINQGICQLNLQKYFKNLPPLENIARNISLILKNDHFSLTGHKCLASNVVEVAGLHIPQEVKPLSLDLEKFISEAKYGVVYMSFGSVIRTSSMSKDKLETILDTIRQMPQRFIWKWEDEAIPGAPKNLLTRSWLPQFDILSHENVKAFVSHAGMMGTVEAIHTGVPVIAMPQFGDQPANGASIEESGLGVVLDYAYLDTQNFKEALLDVLSPERQQKVKVLSQMWRDRPMPPLETAIFWTEYVARYGGPKSMRSPAAELPFYKYYLLDILAVLLIVLFLSIYIPYKIATMLFSAIFKRNKKNSNKPSKSKSKRKAD